MTLRPEAASQKYPNKAILVSNLKFFCFTKTLQPVNIRGGDFKYGNNFFKFHPKIPK